jgi:hypothetical protein
VTMRFQQCAGSGFATPTRGGWPPRIRGLAPVAALALAAACSNGSADQVTKPVSVGMTSKIAPYYMDGQITLYEVQSAVTLPVRKPTSAESQALGPAPKGSGYPHAPFLTAQDESVEVHFVLTNVDTAPHNVWLLVDPWNEFVRWKPGVSIVSDEETIPNNGYDQQYVLPAMSRVEGTITPDDIQEIATKLAAVQAFLASPQGQPTTATASGDDGSDNSLDPTEVCNNIFDYQNRSNSVPPDLFYTPWIPSVVAGLTGFDLGLRMEVDEDDGPGGAGNVAIEITMDVQDLNGDRFVAQDSTDAQIGMPSKTLSPPAARF